MYAVRFYEYIIKQPNVFFNVINLNFIYQGNNLHYIDFVKGKVPLWEQEASNWQVKLAKHDRCITYPELPLHDRICNKIHQDKVSRTKPQLASSTCISTPIRAMSNSLTLATYGICVCLIICLKQFQRNYQPQHHYREKHMVHVLQF